MLGLRLLRRHRRPPRRRRGRPRRSRRTPRATAARCCRSRPCTARPRRPRSPCPGHAWLPTQARCASGSTTRPLAYLKIASGLRPALHVLRDPVLPRLVRLAPAGRRARRGAVAGRQGARELVLVSENSTSYGKDLGDLRALETLLPQLGRGRRHRADPGVATCSRPSCVPSLLEAIATTPGVAPYFDLSFQHAVADGAAPDEAVRLDRRVPRHPRAGARARPRGRRPHQRDRRLPGETEDDLAELERS